jgi:hypothetical protein
MLTLLQVYSFYTLKSNLWAIQQLIYIPKTGRSFDFCHCTPYASSTSLLEIVFSGNSWGGEAKKYSWSKEGT